MDRRYWPRQFHEIEGTPQTWINEPLPPDNVRALVRPNPRSLHAVLCEAPTDALGSGRDRATRPAARGGEVALCRHAASGEGAYCVSRVGRARVAIFHQGQIGLFKLIPVSHHVVIALDPMAGCINFLYGDSFCSSGNAA